MAAPLYRSSFAARAGQQPDVILKDASSAEQQQVVFNPHKEGAKDLAAVEQAPPNANPLEESLARVFYSPDSELAVNEQINHEYTMSYVYHQMASYFNRDNVALPGFASFFRESSLDERSHAQALMDFQATRGGRVKLATISAPETDYNHPDKGDALHAMEIALALEKLNFQFLYKLHKVAEDVEDAQFADFVEDMLAEQATGVKQVADYVSQLRRVGRGLGVYQFDKDIQERANTLSMASVSAA